jgi:hypothetical protein
MIKADLPYPWVFAVVFLDLAMLTLWFKACAARRGDFHDLLLAIMRIRYLHESDEALDKLMPKLFWCVFVMLVIVALMGAGTGAWTAKEQMEWSARHCPGAKGNGA